MNTTPPPHRISDTELLALTAISNNEAVLMAGDNAIRTLCGESPAWRDGCGYMEATDKLRTELYHRGILT